MKKFYVCFLLTGLMMTSLLTSCGGGGGGAAAILSKTPGDVVKSAINALKDKDYPGVIKYYVRKDGVAFTKEDTEKFTGLCTWASQEYEKKQGLKGIEILEEKVAEDGMTATVKYKLQFNNGTEDNDKVDLKKINGDWLIIIGN
jgi:hypothetical protein